MPEQYTPAVMLEAMRLAKLVIKDGLRANHYNIGDIPSECITDWAKMLIAKHNGIVHRAENNLKQRSVETRTSA